MNVCIIDLSSILQFSLRFANFCCLLQRCFFRQLFSVSFQFDEDLVLVDENFLQLRIVETAFHTFVESAKFLILLHTSTTKLAFELFEQKPYVFLIISLRARTYPPKRHFLLFCSICLVFHRFLR
ncbi:hypothetical protein CW304_02555 [Bacillus sp. UFRGS-B20]|nr:hypothetical protein CW304_02555 [Bacillus sp. UFRGS-B20]